MRTQALRRGRGGRGAASVGLVRRIISSSRAAAAAQSLMLLLLDLVPVRENRSDLSVHERALPAKRVIARYLQPPPDKKAETERHEVNEKRPKNRSALPVASRSTILLFKPTLRTLSITNAMCGHRRGPPAAPATVGADDEDDDDEEESDDAED
jgi:hypothetical protein